MAESPRSTSAKDHVPPSPAGEPQDARCAADSLAGLRVALAGGGTGGHLMPGVATAAAVRERIPDAEILFFGTQGDLEKQIVSQYNFPLRQIHTMKRGGGLKALPKLLLSSLRSLIEAYFAVRRFRPDIIVGLGGFGCVFPALAGAVRGIPFILLEQNVLPGFSTRWLSRLAAEVDCQWAESEAHLSKRAVVRVTGNPVRKEIIEKSRHPDYARFGFSAEKKTLLVTGGSQGALRVNELIVECLPFFEKEKHRLQVLHCTGKVSYDFVRKAYERYSITRHVCEYLDDMAAAYAVTDLAVSRAGGTTIAELTCTGIPSVLIPLPTAADDHQRLNGEALAARGAAVCLVQAELTGEKLWSVIRDILFDEERLARIKQAAADAGVPEAADVVLQRICAVASRHSKKWKVS